MYIQYTVHEEVVIGTISPNPHLFHYFVQKCHFWFMTFWPIPALPETQLGCRSRTSCIPHLNWTTSFIMHKFFPFGWPKRTGVDGSGWQWCQAIHMCETNKVSITILMSFLIYFNKWKVTTETVFFSRVTDLILTAKSSGSWNQGWSPLFQLYFHGKNVHQVIFQSLAE
jgi:hypothetical protein